MAGYSTILCVVAAVLITLVIILTVLVVATVIALKKLVGAVVWFFTPSSKASAGPRLGAPPGGGAPDYTGSLCANYCDAADPACSEACLDFRAGGPLFR